MAKPKAKRHKKSGSLDDHRMARKLDELAEHEEFKATILPTLRKELAKGTPGNELLARFTTEAAARLITIIMTDPDSGRAISAIKELNDRVEGKAAQKVEQTHKFERLKEEELDALLTSKLKEIESGEDDEDSMPN